MKKIIPCVFILLLLLVSCTKNEEKKEPVKPIKEFSTPQKMLGKWSGVKLELISEGITYDEAQMRISFLSSMSQTEQDVLILTLRMQFMYEFLDDNVVFLKVRKAYDSATYYDAVGELFEKEGEENSFIGKFDTSYINVKDFKNDLYKELDISYDGTNVIVKTPIGANTLVTYYSLLK